MHLSVHVIQHAILYLIAFILCTSVHEFGHAWIATKLGDQLPRAQGRLTLNPLHHIDPIGTILMPLVMGLTAGASGRIPLLAWGRPVQTNPTSYTRRLSRSTGRMMVALAGPAMNLLMAVFVSLAIVVLARVGVMSETLGVQLVQYLVALNLWLMAFNLLPIHPLDGGAILEWILPPSMQGVSDFLRQYGGFILLGMLFVPQLMGVIMFPAAVLVHWWRDVLMNVAFP